MIPIDLKLVGKITAVVTLLTSVLALGKYIYDSGYTAASVSIQAEHNKLIEAQRKEANEKLAKRVEEHNKLIADAVSARDAYWTNKLKREQDALIANQKIKEEAWRIEHESHKIDTGCTAISNDALELFKRTRRIISTGSGN